jgi:hypothetical protein
MAAPKMMEAPEAERQAPVQTAPPLQQIAEQETKRDLSFVRSTQDRSIIGKANLNLGNLLRNCTHASMRLAKTMTGSVGNVFKTVSKLGRFVGGV